MFIRPVTGRLVRWPDTRIVVPPEGVEVTDSTWWRRRIAQGDVVIVEPGKSDAPAAPHDVVAAEPHEETAAQPDAVHGEHA